MTTICGGGTSGPKPGVDTSVYVDSAYVQSLLPTALAWLYPYLPWMSALEIGNVSTFCSTDPPAVAAVPSAADIFSLLTGGNLGNAIAVNTFLQNIAKQYLWRSLCQCTTGSASAYSPPANPGGLPSVNNPTVVSGPTADACYDFTSSLTNFTGGSSLSRGLITVNGTNPAVGPLGLASYVKFTTTTAVVSTPAPQLTLQYIVDNELTSPNTVFQTISYTVLAGLSRTITLPIDPKATNVHYNVTAGTGAGQTSETTRIQIYCGGDMPGIQDCCNSGPDQSNILLRQILDMVTLVQRSHVPYAYVDGATHSGLSGAGTLTIPNGLLGLRATVTTNPGYTGSAGTNPTAIFDIGYLSVGDSSGWADVQPVRRSPWIWFPDDMTSWTRVGYNLNPGVVMSITELQAEAV